MIADTSSEPERHVTLLLLQRPQSRTDAVRRTGTRTVAEYLLSPVRKAWHEAGRER